MTKDWMWSSPFQYSEFYLQIKQILEIRFGEQKMVNREESQPMSEERISTQRQKTHKMICFQTLHSMTSGEKRIWKFFDLCWNELTFSLSLLTQHKKNRLFGIVLVKLTQCGSDVDKDMYDKVYNWRTSVMTLNFESSPSYKKLVEWCFTARVTSPIVSGLIRSICIHEINPQPLPEHDSVDPKETFEQQKVEDLALLRMR